MEEDYAFKIVVIGDENVGKTSICGRYVDSGFNPSYKPTIGMNIAMVRMSIHDKKGKERQCAVGFWDIAGHEKYRTIRPAYYKGCSATVLVYDVTKKESLDNLSSFWIPDYTKYGDLPPFFVLIGNKNDLVDKKVVKDEEAKALADKIGAKMFSVISAKTGENVETSLHWIISSLVKIAMKGEKW